MYEYNATVTSVYDGDTITCLVDLGFEVSVKKRIRLYGINTPEIKGEDKKYGKLVRDYLRGLILNKKVKLKTIKTKKGKDKKGKYGRYLATIFYDDLNINDHLVAIGYAIKYIV